MLAIASEKKVGRQACRLLDMDGGKPKERKVTAIHIIVKKTPDTKIYLFTSIFNCCHLHLIANYTSNTLF